MSAILCNTPEAAFSLFLQHLGVYVDTEHTRGTPSRVVRAYKDFFKVGEEEPRFTTFKAIAHDMVVVKNIHFYSLCAHHLLPFFGTACIAYIPKRKIVGLSKLARTVSYFSHRLQVQEELTSQIADYLVKKLGTKDVAVLLRCEHLCMSMRGVNSPGHETVTTALRGSFFKDMKVRTEFYSMLRVR